VIACEFCARDSTVSAKMYAKIISGLFWPLSLGGPVEFVHPAHLTAKPLVGLCWCCLSGRAGILTRQTARHTHARNRFVNRKTRIIGGGGAREDAGNGTRALDGRSEARFCAVSTLVVVENIARRFESTRVVESKLQFSIRYSQCFCVTVRAGMAYRKI